MSISDNGVPTDLSDFEYYVFRDDSADHPMVMVLRIHLEGELNSEIFQASLKTAVQHHPLLRSRVVRNGRRLSWQPAADHCPSISVAEHDGANPPADCPAERIDLTQQTGARFEIRRCPKRSLLICWFHHACVDGIGAIRFLADVFAEYGRQTAADEQNRPQLSYPDPDILETRGHCPPIGAGGGQKKRWTEWLRGPSRFLLGRNYCIRGAENTEQSNPVPNILHTAVVPRATLRRLKQLAAVRQVSTNDLCMVVYLQELAQWTQNDRGARDRDLLRVLMPVSMRTADHDQISAANVLSYVFQPFRRRDCRNPEALLAAVHRRTTEMIHSNEGAVLLKLFAFVRRVPGLFRFSQWLQPSFATAVLANVGELKRVFGSRFPLKKGRVVAGNVTIMRIDGIAPLRRNTNIAVSFGGYGGDLILNLRANPQALSESEAALFLEQIVRRLTEMAENQTLTGVPDTTIDRQPVATEEPS